MASSQAAEVPFGVGPVLSLVAQNVLFTSGLLVVVLVAWHAHLRRRRVPGGRLDTDAGIAVAAAWAIALVAGCTGTWISVFGAWVLGGGVGLVIGLGHLSVATAARIWLLPAAAIILLVGGASSTATITDTAAWALVHLIPSTLFGLAGAAGAWAASRGLLRIRRPHSVPRRPSPRPTAS